MTAFLSVLRILWPFLLSAFVGGTVSWQIQGIRVQAAKQDTRKVEQKFEDYKSEQRRLLVEAGEKAEKRRETTIKDWSDKYAKLQQDNDIFRRCVAAGKCGRVLYVPGGAGVKLPSASGTNAASSDTVSSAPGITAQDQVLKDCAVTTLILNSLQTDIEKQYIGK